MLESHSKRICTFFAADFTPQIGYAIKLSEAAHAIQGKLNAPNWGSGPAAYVLRDPKQRFILHIDFRRIACQTLGLDSWQKGLDEYGAVIKIGLEKIGVNSLKRLGFKLLVYLPLGMSHAEMCDLLFGSFLLPAKEFEGIVEKPDDAFVQIHGSHNNMKAVILVAPMTVEQATQSFAATPNLEHFLEPKLMDTGAKEFRDRLDSPCFHVDVDLSRTDIPVGDVQPFLKDSLNGALHLCEQSVQRLRSLNAKKG